MNERERERERERGEMRHQVLVFEDVERNASPIDRWLNFREIPSYFLTLHGNTSHSSLATTSSGMSAERKRKIRETE